MSLAGGLGLKNVFGLGSLLLQDIVARSISLTQATGLVAIQTVTGARTKLGTGTSDYLISDGSNNIGAAGTFSAQSVTATTGAGVITQMTTAPSTALLDTMGFVADGASAIANRIGNRNALTNATAQIVAFYSDFASTKVLAIDLFGKLIFSGNTDSSGTPGNATANTPLGKAAIAIGAASCVISNTLVTANSRIFITPRARDATGLLPTVTAQSAGVSFTVTTTANCTAALSFDWWVIN